MREDEKRSTEKLLNTPNRLAEAALIAASYAVLTALLAPISYGPVQVRIAEALCVLAAFTPAAVPGLFAGCLVANLMSPYGLLDMAVGGLATLLGAWGTYRLARRPAGQEGRSVWLLPLPQVLTNSLLVGTMLSQLSGINRSWAVCILWVALGEALSCYGLGLPLWFILNKNRNRFVQQ